MGEFTPPAGSQEIPHPRTANDVLARSAAIHVFAAVAYLHLCYLLGFRRPHGASVLPAVLAVAFLLLPELVIVQAVFGALVPMAIAAPYRQRVVDRLARLPRELGVVSPKTGRTQLWRLGVHAAFAALNALPLAAVVGGYRQRLRMTYHQLTYVANLGLDHRNGWLACGALGAVALTQVLLVALAALVAGGAAAAAGQDDLPLPAEGDDGGGEGAVERAEPEPEGQRAGAGLVARVDWSAVAELVYVSIPHQFLVRAVHHGMPAAALVRAWYLWPLVVAPLGYLYARRRLRRELLLLYAALLLIVATVGFQLAWDAKELLDVQAGRMEPWNFRWQVKDRVSASYEVE